MDLASEEKSEQFLGRFRTIQDDSERVQVSDDSKRFQTIIGIAW